MSLFHLLRRRRVSIMCVILFILIVQYIFHQSLRVESNCEPQQTPHVTLSWDQVPANFSNRENIVNLNPRILCWIPTTLKRLNRSAIIYQTWAKRCDRSVFIVGSSPPSIPLNRTEYPFPIVFLADDKIEKYNQLPEKVLLALLHLYQHFLDDFDWFLKADDDTYVIVENLRHFLRFRSSNFSLYYGYIARTPDRFYPSGGAGYVLSHEALKQFGEKILVKPDQRQLCRTDQAEDINLAYCLARIGIHVTNARDNQQRETFHPMTFEQHFLGKFTRWIEKNAQFVQEKGERCCSTLTISFHSLTPEEILMMDFLLYRLEKATI